MIYLIGKIFVYLLLALGLGAAAGWLWRNLQAAGREAELERALMESRSRLPQMDTTLRAREERLERTLAELKTRDAALAEQQQQLAERDRAIAELERACAELRQRQTGAASATPAQRDGGDALERHAGGPGGAADTGSTAMLAEREAVHAAAIEAAESEREALQAELSRTRTELERVTAALAAEKRQVSELARERDLQHRSLKALEQQLDLARDDDHRVANG